jgi:UDP-glucose 4-epimerase
MASLLKGQRILITGGLGYIGSNLAHQCLKEGASVTIYDCLDPRSGGNMYNVDDIQNDVEIILNDIRNFEGVSSCIRNKDVLFNCAAYTSHPNSMKEPLIDIDVNCKGVINILEASRRFNSEIRLVHIGTSTQIGRMQSEIIDELHPEFPLDIYSANKSASEKYILIYGNAYKMNTSVIRLANVYGPRSNIRSSDFGFMNYFIGLALQKKEIPIFGDGAQRRNITYVDDCISALIEASINHQCMGKVLFAVSDSQYTMKEIAEAICTHIGGSIRFVEWPKERMAIEIGDIAISNRRIKELLNWRPQFDLRRGLIDTKAYYESCLQKYL